MSSFESNQATIPILLGASNSHPIGSLQFSNSASLLPKSTLTIIFYREEQDIRVFLNLNTVPQER